MWVCGYLSGPFCQVGTFGFLVRSCRLHMGGDLRSRPPVRTGGSFEIRHSTFAIVKTLGVTGGIGSGKTTVCGFLEEKGAKVFYADL